MPKRGTFVRLEVCERLGTCRKNCSLNRPNDKRCSVHFYSEYVKGVPFSMEVIRKGYLSGQKWYGLDHGAEPPFIKPC